ncbi:MAG TPA: hypothetical protein VFU67_01130 [Nitrososphaeraceae archaeon]|nr:hypothetical protein [Nitrososphaeraceae archaeon]
MSNKHNPYEISKGKHVMLLCEDKENRAEQQPIGLIKDLKRDNFVSMLLSMPLTKRMW